MNPRFVELARDPQLIPGVYNYCDQWCSYCPVTGRCLAYRCLTDRQKRHVGDMYEGLASSLNETMAFTRDVVAAEGGSTPELDALAALGPVEAPPLPEVDDPLEKLGREYALKTSAFLMSVGWQPPEPEPAATGPAAIDVVAWYHVRLAAKIFRALVSAAQARAGVAERAEDANGSAKVALLGIDRSRKALGQLTRAHADPRIEHLRTLLDRLGPAVERRFPKARQFVRPGLDEARA
jgi:hypothetical protein